jgi:putative spermidine/putrescine transport system substrate-binding protein
MRATRRRLLSASITLGMSFIRPASAAPVILTFAAYGGLFQNTYEPAIVEPFRHNHAGIGVFYLSVPSSTQTLAALRRQSDLPEADVVLLDLASARIATDEGLLEPLKPGSLPVLAELTPAAVFPGIAGRALYTEPLVLLFDAAHVPPPTTWKTLWNGGDEKVIAIPAPPDSIGLAFTIVAGRLFGGGTEPRAAASGITAINDLSRAVVTWDPRPDVYRFLSDGGARLGAGWNMQAQLESDRTAGRLGIAFPNEGTISRVVTINLVKGAPHPEAARTFIEYLLGQEAQKTMVEQMFLGPVNAHAKYSEASLQRTANTPERVARAMPVDWVSVNTIRDGIIQRWRQVIPDAG